MDSVLQAAAIYIILVVLLRLTGKRTLGELSVFDFILLLIVSEATQQALLGDDFSLTNALLVILTLLGLDVFLTYLKQKSKALNRLFEDIPLVIMKDGKPDTAAMKKARIDDSDILEAARAKGVSCREDIAHAILEKHGGISIIPKKPLPYPPLSESTNPRKK